MAIVADFIKIGMMQSIHVSPMNLTDLIGPVVNSEPEPGSPRRIVLWGRDDLLAQAIGSFLNGTAWNVIRVSHDGDVEQLFREVRRVNPEAVILCRYNGDESTIALRLIEELCCQKVVTVGLDSNQMQVYSKQSIILQGATDLLSIIEKEKFSGCIPQKEAESKEQHL